MKNETKRELLLQALFIAVSLLASAAFCLRSAIAYPEGGVQFLVEYSFRSLLCPRLLIYFAAAFALCNLASLLGRRFISVPETVTSNISRGKCFASAFVPLLLSSIVCWLQYWPCTGFIDSVYIIQSGVSIYRQHPFWYCLLYNLLYRFAGLFFASDANRYALIACFQLLLMDGLLALSAVKLRRYMPKPLVILYVALFTFLPIYPLYSVTILKDGLFGIAMLWLTLWVLDVIVSGTSGLEHKAGCFKAILIFFPICALRNNGKYILLLLMIVLFIVYRRRHFIFSCTALFAAAVTLCFAPNVLMNIVSPRPELFQETVAVPIQQTCAVIKYGNELDADDSEVLGRVLNFDFVRENFDPYDVDVIKWSDDDTAFSNEALCRDKPGFIKAWLHLVLQNKSLCLKEWLLMTYGYWAGDDFDNYSQSTMYRMVGNVTKTQLPEKVYDILHNAYYSHAAFFSGGACLVLTLLFCLLTVRRAPALLILTVPLFANLLSLFAAVPIAMGYRYIIPYIYILPALFLLLASCVTAQCKKINDAKNKSTLG